MGSVFYPNKHCLVYGRSEKAVVSGVGCSNIEVDHQSMILSGYYSASIDILNITYTEQQNGVLIVDECGPHTDGCLEFFSHSNGFVGHHLTAAIAIVERTVLNNVELIAMTEHLVDVG